MKPSWKEFRKAFITIMDYIDDEPHSRPLFHALLTFYLRKTEGEEESTDIA